MYWIGSQKVSSVGTPDERKECEFSESDWGLEYNERENGCGGSMDAFVLPVLSCHQYWKRSQPSCCEILLSIRSSFKCLLLNYIKIIHLLDSHKFSPCLSSFTIKNKMILDFIKSCDDVRGVSVASSGMQYLNSMEKSMVQELSALTHSTIFSSRPSFLLGDSDRPDLRRSRIQNLPGYRKEDLSSRINFVVVFQTIEIERLTQEIDALRVMARDAERQRLNFSNYEVQIRELTERCHAYEMQEEDKQQEMQRLRQFCERLVGEVEASRAQEGLREKYQAERTRCQQLQSEVDRWRTRFTALELSRNKELEEMRLQLESRRRSQISRQTRELTIKHENELSALSSDLRKAREELQLRISEIARLEDLVEKFRIREEEMQEVEDKMYEYENRYVLLSQENYRLNELLRKRTDELERLRRSEQELRTRVENGKGLEEQTTRLQGELEIKQKTIIELERQLRVSAESSERMAKEYQKAQGYQQLVSQLSAELERVNSLMREKVSEIDSLRNGQRLLESKLSASSTATQREFATYQQRLISYTKEQERLSAQLRHRLTENEQLKARIVQLEKAGNSSMALRQENEGLRGQLGQYNNKIDEFNRKIRLLQENLRLMEEIEKKFHIEEQSKREVAADRDRLNLLLRQLTLRAETATQKAQAAEEAVNRAAGAQVEIRELRQRVAWMTQELDRLGAQIARRVAELQQLKETVRGLSNSKASYQGIQQRLVSNLAQMEQMVLEVDRTRRQNDRLLNDNMNLQSNLRSLQGQILEITEEKQEMNRIIASQGSELQEVKNKLQQYSAEGRARAQLEQVVQEQQRKLDNFKAMYSQLEERLRKETAQSEAMVYELMQIRSQPRVSKELTEELLALRRQTEEQQRTINVLFGRIQNIQAILKTVKQGYTAQFQELINLRERLTQLSARASAIDELQVMLEGYLGKVEGLREENLRLESQNVLAGIQFCESHKILQEPSVEAPRPSVKNSSIAYKVAAQDVKGQDDGGYVFTFKEVHRQHSLTNYDQIKEHAEGEQSERARSPEEGSMASSFINTLITKESSARFDHRHQQTENNAFGANPNSKLRYLPAGQQLRYREEYLPIDRDIENLPIQINRTGGTPMNQRGGAFFENAGIKRVTSYTHFAPTPIQSSGSPSYLHRQPRDSSQGHRAPSSPSQNTVNSTNEFSQLGRRIRIPADPARLLLYRQH